jgi:hypothetical protein
LVGFAAVAALAAGVAFAAAGLAAAFAAAGLATGASTGTAATLGATVRFAPAAFWPVLFAGLTVRTAAVAALAVAALAVAALAVAAFTVAALAREARVPVAAAAAFAAVARLAREAGAVRSPVVWVVPGRCAVPGRGVGTLLVAVSSDEPTARRRVPRAVGRVDAVPVTGSDPSMRRRSWWSELMHLTSVGGHCRGAPGERSGTHVNTP